MNSFYRIKEDRADIQGGSGEKANNLGVDSMGYCKEKKYIDMCIILNGDRDNAISISRTN